MTSYIFLHIREKNSCIFSKITACMFGMRKGSNAMEIFKRFFKVFLNLVLFFHYCIIIDKVSWCRDITFHGDNCISWNTDLLKIQYKINWNKSSRDKQFCPDFWYPEVFQWKLKIENLTLHQDQWSLDSKTTNFVRTVKRS